MKVSRYDLEYIAIQNASVRSFHLSLSRSIERGIDAVSIKFAGEVAKIDTVCRISVSRLPSIRCRVVRRTKREFVGRCYLLFQFRITCSSDVICNRRDGHGRAIRAGSKRADEVEMQRA